MEAPAAATPEAAPTTSPVAQAPDLSVQGADVAAPPGVEILCGDAALTMSYAGAVPAEIVLANGVFGNISDADIQHTIKVLPSLCAPDAAVLWTRHRRPPDVTPQIRAWLRG